MVSLSALLTCRKAGIRPVAVIEEEPAPQVPWPLGHAPGYFGIPLHLNSQVTGIFGRDRVSHIQFTDGSGQTREIQCDGILFTGMFTPESSLVRMGHLKMDRTSGSPIVDRFGRCSDPRFYAVGNLMPPLNMAMNCWRAGRKIARTIIQDLKGEIPPKN